MSFSIGCRAARRISSEKSMTMSPPNTLSFSIHTLCVHWRPWDGHPLVEGCWWTLTSCQTLTVTAQVGFLPVCISIIICVPFLVLEYHHFASVLSWETDSEYPVSAISEGTLPVFTSTFPGTNMLSDSLSHHCPLYLAAPNHLKWSLISKNRHGRKGIYSLHPRLE